MRRHIYDRQAGAVLGHVPLDLSSFVFNLWFLQLKGMLSTRRESREDACGCGASIH